MDRRFLDSDRHRLLMSDGILGDVQALCFNLRLGRIAGSISPIEQCLIDGREVGPGGCLWVEAQEVYLRRPKLRVAFRLRTSR